VTLGIQRISLWGGDSLWVRVLASGLRALGGDRPENSVLEFGVRLMTSPDLPPSGYDHEQQVDHGNQGENDED
jgi:hypothetical protein